MFWNKSFKFKKIFTLNKLPKWASAFKTMFLLTMIVVQMITQTLGKNKVPYFTYRLRSKKDGLKRHPWHDFCPQNSKRSSSNGLPNSTCTKTMLVKPLNINPKKFSTLNSSRSPKDQISTRNCVQWWWSLIECWLVSNRRNQDLFSGSSLESWFTRILQTAELWNVKSNFSKFVWYLEFPVLISKKTL